MELKTIDSIFWFSSFCDNLPDENVLNYPFVVIGPESTGRKYSKFFKETKNFEQQREELAQYSLRNPLFHGEAMRALTYPDSAYRIIKMPRSWVDNDIFLEKTHFFLPRFVFSYHDEEKGWEICSNDQCELKGSTLEEFFEALIPQER